jgi:hypothetical protein
MKYVSVRRSEGDHGEVVFVVPCFLRNCQPCVNREVNGGVPLVTCHSATSLLAENPKQLNRFGGAGDTQ